MMVHQIVVDQSELCHRCWPTTFSCGDTPWASGGVCIGNTSYHDGYVWKPDIVSFFNEIQRVKGNLAVCCKHSWFTFYWHIGKNSGSFPQIATKSVSSACNLLTIKKKKKVKCKTSLTLILRLSRMVKASFNARWLRILESYQVAFRCSCHSGWIFSRLFSPWLTVRAWMSLQLFSCFSLHKWSSSLSFSPPPRNLSPTQLFWSSFFSCIRSKPPPLVPA